MYPVFEILGIKIYTFGLLIAIAWMVFLALLQHYSWKAGLKKPHFASVGTYTVVIFLMSRLFDIFADWREQKFILMDLSDGNILWFLRGFFMQQNYSFSVVGAVLWFFLVFLTKSYLHREDRAKYLDIMLEAFLPTAMIGYFATLLWGELYGIPFWTPLAIIYDHKESIVPLRDALFPLPIVYMIAIGCIWWGLQKLRRHIHLPPGFLASFGFGLYSATVFLLEFLNGKEDIFESMFYLNLNQIAALVGITYGIIWVLHRMEK